MVSQVRARIGKVRTGRLRFGEASIGKPCWGLVRTEVRLGLHWRADVWCALGLGGAWSDRERFGVGVSGTVGFVLR